MKKNVRMNFVNLYLTPIGTAIVLSLLVYSIIHSFYLYSTIALSAFVLFNNTVTVLNKEKTKTVYVTRMVTNILVNIWFVYIFIDHVQSVWFLLLLTPVATAVYSSRLRTFILSLIMGGALVYMQIARDLYGAEDWAMTITRVVIIIVLSQFVCALLQRREFISSEQ